MNPHAGLVFSVATPEDWVSLETAQRWVYWGKESEDPIDPPEEGERGYIVSDDGEVVSGAKVYDYPVLVRGREYTMGGVAGVATLVEARRSGAAHVLMEGLLRDLHKNEVPLSCLYAFREAYYRRFGYELSGWRWEIKCPAHRIPKVESSLKVRRVKKEEAATLLGDCYATFAKTLSGSHVRDESSWKDRLGQTPPTIYAVGDPVEGYFWGNFSGFWEDVSIGEFVWTTHEGYKGLLSLLSGICSNKTGATWVEPPLSPLLYVLRDQGAPMTMNRPTMWRITHLAKAFETLASDQEFVFEVKDTVIPEQNGVFRVTSKGLEPAENPDFTIGIGALSQAFLGQPSLADLAALGQVQVHNPEGFAKACQVFSPQNVVCMEFF